MEEEELEEEKTKCGKCLGHFHVLAHVHVEELYI